MYKAIIMAAGTGTRISRKIGDNCKCTLDIGGIPLIRHTIEMLIKHGVEPHLVVGYNKHRIKESLEGLDITFHENIFYSITNSLASLWFARDELCGPSIILGNADVYWEDNLLSILLEEKRECVMLSDSSRVEQGDYLLRVEDGTIKGYGKGMNCRDANCEYVGLALIQGDMVEKSRKKLVEMVERQRHSDWWEQILYTQTSYQPIYAKDIAGHFWAEIDFVEDYERILAYRRQLNEE